LWVSGDLGLDLGGWKLECMVELYSLLCSM
jgi:hypothetical protein